jgi:hypothetical protein
MAVRMLGTRSVGALRRDHGAQVVLVIAAIVGVRILVRRNRARRRLREDARVQTAVEQGLRDKELQTSRPSARSLRHGRLVDVPATPMSAEFTSSRVVQIARDGAGEVGLEHDQMELIRLGSNAIVRLAGGVIARVARDESWAETSEREVRVATELLRAGVPCVQPWPVNQPVIISGHPVTFWVEVPGPLEQPTLAELGRVLRQVHRTGGDLGLPALDPWAHIPERIEQAKIS